jgi:hypothetical protein
MILVIDHTEHVLLITKAEEASYDLVCPQMQAGLVSFNIGSGSMW